jgi:hypothetical protein
MHDRSGTEDAVGECRERTASAVAMGRLGS